MRKDILDLIRSNSVCVLATVSEGKPHCSLMSYVTDTNSQIIYMITQRGTKKYRNVSENNSVSLLVDTRQVDSKNKIKALTITGTFQSSFDESEKKDIKNRLLKINPDLKEVIDNPTAEIIAVHIKAVQLLNGIKESYFEIVA